MGDWDDDRGGFRTSMIGRVDWSCWLAVVGLLFVTVISFFVQFPLMGVITTIIAVLLVVFDSWVNRPTGGRSRARYEESERYDGTGWSDVRRVDSRQQQAVRQQQPPPPRPANRPAPNVQGRQNQGQPPRPQGQPGRPYPGPGQQPPMRPNQGQPMRPNPGQPQPTRVNQGQPQPTRVNQGQPQRPPFRPAPPPQPPARGREPDFRART